MTFPVTIHIGAQDILLHNICEFVGIFTAFRYYLYLKRRHGDSLPYYHRIYIVIAATFGAVIGSHLLGALEDLPHWRQASSPLVYLIGNKTLVGGLLGALLAVELTKKLVHERQNSGDLFVYPLMLGMIIGRIGCFSVGIHEETYGLPSSLPWAMDLGDGMTRHPVALYEILFLALLWISLYAFERYHTLAQGARFKIFMIAYLLFRFLLDLIKPGWRYLFGLGSIQIACLAGLFYYFRYLLRPRLLLAKSPTP